MKIRNGLFGILLLSLFSFPTGLCISAEPGEGGTLQWYRYAKKSPRSEFIEIVKTYIKGVGDGFLYANATLIASGQQPLYCQPIGLTLIGRNFVDILEREIQRAETAGRPWRDDHDIPHVLLRGLQNTFPCPK